MLPSWSELIGERPRVQKLVHLAMRWVEPDQQRIRAELTRTRQKAYEDEITIQARRVGCPRGRGRLTSGPSLRALDDLSRRDAASIVNTYNRDLAYAIRTIRAEAPRANRYVYRKRLLAWDGKRKLWKDRQVAEYTVSTARRQAQQDFVRFNDIQGAAVLGPTRAVCPVCQGWVARGEVPLNVAMNNPPPYHVNCPHVWTVKPNKVAASECRDLWLGE